MPNRASPCLLFQVKSASPEHRAALKMAIGDLNAALGYPAFALSKRGRNMITFDARAFERDEPKTIGHVVDLPDDRWVVSIRPELEGAALLSTIVHELGHVLGLGHVRDGFSTKNHIMSIELSAKRRRLTARTRQRWAAQVAHEAAKMRIRAHVAQIA